MQSHRALCHLRLYYYSILSRYYLSRCPASIKSSSLLYHSVVTKKYRFGLEWIWFQIKTALIPDAILSLDPIRIHVKSPKRLSFNQKTWNHGSMTACFPIVEVPLSKTLKPCQFHGCCSDLHVENIPPWKSMNLHSIIYFSHKQHKTWLHKLLFI